MDGGAAGEVEVLLGRRGRGGGGGGEPQRPGPRDHCSPVSEVAERTACLCAELSPLKSPVTPKHRGTSKNVTAQWLLSTGLHIWGATWPRGSAEWSVTNTGENKWTWQRPIPKLETMLIKRQLLWGFCNENHSSTNNPHLHFEYLVTIFFLFEITQL